MIPEKMREWMLQAITHQMYKKAIMIYVNDSHDEHLRNDTAHDEGNRQHLTIQKMIQ